MSDTASDVLPTSAMPIESSGHQRLFQAVAYWSVVAFFATIFLILGLMLRRYAWDQTEPIRYVMDIDNAFRQGTMTLQNQRTTTQSSLLHGFIERYDKEETLPNNTGMMALDYAPGRLAVATLWTRWVREKLDGPILPGQPILRWPEEFYARARAEHRQYELCQPLLMVNTTGEILSAIAMFFLVRRYTSGIGPTYRPNRGTALGFIAALFFWFNPALIWNAHCWPQWDSQVLPFFLWAVLLASLDWWFCAGLIIAAGTMFKAQILFGAPLLILWPLFQGRLPALLRWITGLLSGVAGLTAVWMVRKPGTLSPLGQYTPGHVDPQAIEWLIYLALILVGMTSILLFPRQPRARIPVGIALAAVLNWIISSYVGNPFSIVGFAALSITAVIIDQRCDAWNWRARMPLGWIAIAILLYPIYALALVKFVLVINAVVMLGLIIAFAPRRAIPYTAAGWMAGGLLLCIPLFHTSTAWFERGVALGTHHYEKMASGDNNNLAELLKTKWGWEDLMEPVFELPQGETSDGVGQFLDKVDPGVHIKPGDTVGLPLKYFLTGLWFLSVILCAIGTAIQDRRRSPRFLASIAAPWIMFFAVMTQMHQRYLLWGASVSAATVAISPGYAVLHLFLSVVSMSQEMMSMMNNTLDWRNPVRYTDNAAYHFFASWHPGVSWAVLLCACIFVYASVKVDRRQHANTARSQASPAPTSIAFAAEEQRKSS
jgi:hypothetical protein